MAKPTLPVKKKILRTQVGRYMTLLSNLEKPPSDYLDDLDWFRGLIDAADEPKMDELQRDWEQLKPAGDERSMTYIETGKLNN